MEVNNIYAENLALILKQSTNPKRSGSKDSNGCATKNNSHKLRKHCNKDGVESNKACAGGAVHGGQSVELKKVFVQTFNPTLGQVEWQVEEEGYGYTQEVARSAYADMLHDDERNELYYSGLQEAVSIIRSRGQRVRVLDIGTGTGLLSMMAVVCGADEVTACEAFEPMAECAEKILAANNMADKIRVLHKTSTDVSVGPGLDMEERANVLVAELFDTELIGEGAIGTYDHAKQYLLTADAVLVPSSATVYAQVVSSPLLHAFCRPNSSIPSHLQHLRMPPCFDACGGHNRLHDLQMSQLPQGSYTAISEPIPVFQFDWSGRTIELTRKDISHTEFKPLAPRQSSSGEECCEGDEMVCHSVLMWWSISLDQSGEMVLTCAPHWKQPNSGGPNTVPWRDHWMQAVYHLPSPLAKCSIANNSLTLTAARDAYSLWFSVNETCDTPRVLPAPHCSCGLHQITAHSRMAQLSDERRIRVFQSVLEGTLEQQQERTAWLLLGDGINLLIVGILATDDRVSQVYLHEAESRGRGILKQFMDVNGLKERITLLPNDLNKVTPEMICHKIGVVFSEPHFNTTQLPWHNLRANFLLSQIASCVLSSCTAATDGTERKDAWNFKELCAKTIKESDNDATACSEISTENDDAACAVVDADTCKDVHSDVASQVKSKDSHREKSATSTPCNGSSSGVGSDKHSCDTAVCGEDQVSCTAVAPAAARGESVVRALTNAVVLPGRMELYALPISFLNLWKIRAPCVQRCGFDLSIFDELIGRARCRTDDYVEAQPLWEYSCYALHTPIHLMTLDLRTDLTNMKLRAKSTVSLDVQLLEERAKQMTGHRKSTFGSKSRSRMAGNKQQQEEQQLYYNGVAVWADWLFGDSQRLTTGPLQEVVTGQPVAWDMFIQQGVHLPRTSVPLLHQATGSDPIFACDADLKAGEMLFNFDLKFNSPAVSSSHN